MNLWVERKHLLVGTGDCYELIRKEFWSKSGYCLVHSTSPLQWPSQGELGRTKPLKTWRGSRKREKERNLLESCQALVGMRDKDCKEIMASVAPFQKEKRDRMDGVVLFMWWHTKKNWSNSPRKAFYKIHVANLTLNQSIQETKQEGKENLIDERPIKLDSKRNLP